MKTDETTLAKTSLDILRARSKRFDFKTTHATIVLGHEVNLAGRFFVTSHAGLLFQNKSQWSYFEKAGGAGPYVRLDLADPTDLQKWYSSVYPAPRNGYTHFLLSFGDREMFLLPGRNDVRPSPQNRQ